MLILYVPFPREQAGDLVNLVEFWKKNHIKHFDSPIEIIYFDEEINPKLEKHKLDVYICAHGNDDLSFMFVGNNSNKSAADFISIHKLADRFNQDFLYLTPGIKSIHLYCCGSYQKNREMAKQLHDAMLRPLTAINFYNGTITAVDESGKQWSFGGSKSVPVRDALSQFFSPDCFVEQDIFRRKSVKSLPQYEDYLELRRNAFFSRIKEKRWELIKENREKHNVLSSSL